jgi:hypothetical protein
MDSGFLTALFLLIHSIISTSFSQVDLKQPKPLKAVAIQGRGECNQFITKYSLSVSIDKVCITSLEASSNFTLSSRSVFPLSQTNWTTVGTYAACKHSDDLVINVLKQPPTCRYVRIVPLEWVEHISVRMDLLA